MATALLGSPARAKDEISIPTKAKPKAADGLKDAADPLTLASGATNFFDFVAKSGDGSLVSLSRYKGQVVLAVNTASRCGYTQQYSGLQKLHETYHDKGFTVLAFPSNDFGSQEPGSDKEIKSFCETNFKIGFPLFAKSPVTGESKQPIYKFLTERGAENTRGEVKWNFEKFLINRKGETVARFPSATEPESAELVSRLEALIKEPMPSSGKSLAPAKKSSSISPTRMKKANSL